MRWRRRGKRVSKALSMARVIRLLEGEVIWGGKILADKEIAGCFAADLMSDVLAFSKPGVLLLTGLTSVQCVHTADVADLKGIVFVSSKKPPEAVIEQAQKKEIPLLRTPHDLFDACGILYKAGMRAALK